MSKSVLNIPIRTWANLLVLTTFSIDQNKGKKDVSLCRAFLKRRFFSCCYDGEFKQCFVLTQSRCLGALFALSDSWQRVGVLYTLISSRWRAYSSKRSTTSSSLTAQQLTPRRPCAGILWSLHVDVVEVMVPWIGWITQWIIPCVVSSHMSHNYD